MFSVGLFFSFGGSGAWSWALGGGGGDHNKGDNHFPKFANPEPHTHKPPDISC